MNRIKDLHHEAMTWAEQADLARIHGDIAKVDPLLEKAFLAEREAAALCDVHLEPTRSVLHRSAASLALQCKRMREAEQLIAAGLAGNPNEEIAEELRELMKQVWSNNGMALANGGTFSSHAVAPELL